jgi:signal transduction histidine kinase
MTDEIGAGLTGASGRALQVLLVEDDPAFAEFLRAAIPHSGEADLRLCWEPRLSSALEAIRTGHVDAVLLDLNLPDSRGLETLSRVVEAAVHVPVVVLTGVDDRELATEALGRGAQDWLTKGRIDPELVGRAVRYAIERKRLEDRLVRSEKLEVVGRLAGAIAHEFNNLLTVVVGHAALIASSLDDADLRRSLQRIQRAADRGAALTQQLLGFTRNQPVRPDVVDAASLVGGASSLLRAILPETIELRIGHLGPGLVRIDRGHFDQVLLNLAMNARDAMPSGGSITLETRRESVGPGGDGPGSETARPHVVVEVSDTGTGIAPDVLPHIFEPFFSTRKDRGTGLGLAFCAETLAGSGGALRVRSAVGTGTTFLLYLPEVERHAATRPDRAPVTATTSRTILVVDDDTMVRRAVAATLRRDGWSVLESSGGAEALALASAHRGDIDLLLTDVVMPLMRGPELASRLVEVSPGTRVMYMTGYADDAAGLGVSDPGSPILRKPFSPTVLATRIRELLGG